jgi:hypothetical protein
MKKNEHYLTELFVKLKVNAKEFAENLGFDRADRIYHVLKGRNGISEDLAKIITSKYPDVNYTWLLTGEGEMLKTVVSQNIENSSNSVAIGRDSNGNISIASESVDKFIQITEKYQEQTDRMLAIIETLINK